MKPFKMEPTDLQIAKAWEMLQQPTGRYADAKRKLVQGALPKQIADNDLVPLVVAEVLWQEKLNNAGKPCWVVGEIAALDGGLTDRGDHFLLECTPEVLVVLSQHHARVKELAALIPEFGCYEVNDLPMDEFFHGTWKQPCETYPYLTENAPVIAPDDDDEDLALDFEGAVTDGYSDHTTIVSPTGVSFRLRLKQTIFTTFEIPWEMLASRMP